MQADSRPVDSAQTGPHERLAEIVTRHAKTHYARPIAEHNRQAFERASAFVEADGRPVCLDSFCGNGASTAALARANPDHIYLGIDRSAHRLSRHGQIQSDNYRLLRTEAGDFWRLARRAGWRLKEHWLLYPNPWPKAAQLKRRVHGSPVFPDLLAQGGIFQCRSNWRIYIDELALALEQMGYPAQKSVYKPHKPITAFETKYLASGHTLWRCTTTLSANLHQA